jgi:6-phosphogluconolactonase (cycloisomerase 2 family)
VANHNSDNIVIFARDAESGALTATGREIAIGTPMRVQAVVF